MNVGGRKLPRVEIICIYSTMVSVPVELSSQGSIEN